MPLFLSEPGRRPILSRRPTRGPTSATSWRRGSSKRSTRIGTLVWSNMQASLNLLILNLPRKTIFFIPNRNVEMEAPTNTPRNSRLLVTITNSRLIKFRLFANTRRFFQIRIRFIDSINRNYLLIVSNLGNTTASP